MVLGVALAVFIGGFAIGRLTGGGSSQKREKQAKAGDLIPHIKLDKGFPPEKFHLREYCRGKKVVLLGHSIGGAIATHLAATKPALPVSLCNSRSFSYLAGDQIGRASCRERV